MYYSVSAREQPGDGQGAVAQLVAHHTGSVGVRGSSPLSSTEVDQAVLPFGSGLRRPWCHFVAIGANPIHGRQLDPAARPCGHEVGGRCPSPCASVRGGSRDTRGTSQESDVNRRRPWPGRWMPGCRRSGTPPMSSMGRMPARAWLWRNAACPTCWRCRSTGTRSAPLEDVAAYTSAAFHSTRGPPRCSDGGEGCRFLGRAGGQPRLVDKQGVLDE